MEKASNELERARQLLVIERQPVARTLQEKDEDIAPVGTPLPARGAAAVIEEECGPSLTTESRDSQNSDGRIGLNKMVTLKERQQ